MPHNSPSVKDIKERFPEFVSVSDARIGFVIEEAKRTIDVSWADADYGAAFRFLVAHRLVKEGVLNPTGSPPAALTGGGMIASESMGDASISYHRNSSSSISMAVNDLASTIYGQRYLEIARANHSGPIVL